MKKNGPGDNAHATQGQRQDEMEAWQRQIAESITTGATLARHLPVNASAVDRVTRRYPMRIPPYWRNLMIGLGDPFYRQAVPDEIEMVSGAFAEDPFDEAASSPAPGLVHRYPNRVLLLVTRRCAMYCRHCMRKRRTSASDPSASFDAEKAVDYIMTHPEVREVILSGGDPLMLTDGELEGLLVKLGRAGHITVRRIHTRMPCTLPHRITPSLVAMLRHYAPLFLVTQFNHPAEITPEAEAACARLVDAGIPLLCQTVLLKGINDDAGILSQLMDRLLSVRVRPYYLHHPDPVCGTGHFRLPVSTGLAIFAELRRRVSGIGLPQYVMDVPGADGKVPLLPEHVALAGGNALVVVRAGGTKTAIALDDSEPVTMV